MKRHCTIFTGALALCTVFCQCSKQKEMPPCLFVLDAHNAPPEQGHCLLVEPLPHAMPDDLSGGYLVIGDTLQWDSESGAVYSSLEPPPPAFWLVESPEPWISASWRRQIFAVSGVDTCHLAATVPLSIKLNLNRTLPPQVLGYSIVKCSEMEGTETIFDLPTSTVAMSFRDSIQARSFPFDLELRRHEPDGTKKLILSTISWETFDGSVAETWSDLDTETMTK